MSQQSFKSCEYRQSLEGACREL